MDLDEGSLKLVDPENLTVLNTQPIHTIRVWGVGRDNGRFVCPYTTTCILVLYIIISVNAPVCLVSYLIIYINCTSLSSVCLSPTSTIQYFFHIFLSVLSSLSLSVCWFICLLSTLFYIYSIHYIVIICHFCLLSWFTYKLCCFPSVCLSTVLFSFFTLSHCIYSCFSVSCFSLTDGMLY